MARKYGQGLAKLELSDIAVDGDVGTAFVEVGDTVKGTAQLTQSDPTITDFNIEEQDDPVESIVSAEGKKTLVWSCYNVDGATLVKFFGGTYTPYNALGPVHAKYTPPTSTLDVEKSVKVTDKKGNIFTIVRAKITAKFNWSFTGDKLAQLDLSCDILTPTKTGVAPFTIVYPDPS